VKPFCAGAFQDSELFTHYTYDLGKTREVQRLSHAIFIYSYEPFYPALAEVGKKVLKDQAWPEYAVDHRFV
jgi:hypothetical protein